MLRVSTQMMYTQSIDYINNKLSSLTDLNEQASSQKRVNRPSDDAVGAARSRRVVFRVYSYNILYLKWYKEQGSILIITLCTKTKASRKNPRIVSVKFSFGWQFILTTEHK